MQRVFISYAREDEKAARRLYNDLKSRGLNPWLDKESLLPGQNWENEIRRAIKNSRYFIALFSSISVEKKGYIQKEFKYALDVLDEFPDSEIFVIPAKLDSCDIPYEKLQELEYVNLFPNWKEGLRKILRVMVSAENTGGNRKLALFDKIRNKKTVSILSIVVVLAISSVAFIFINNSNYIKHDRTNQISASSSPKRPISNTSDIKFLTYTNSTYGVKMQYPSDWVYFSPSMKGTLHNIIAFHPANSSNLDTYPPSIGVYIDYPNSLNLTEYAKYKWSTYQERRLGSFLNIRLIDFNTKWTFGGHPAYKMVYEIGKYNFVRIGTIIGPRSYEILVIIDHNSFPRYWPIMQKMIDSFKIYNMAAATTPPFTTYTNSTYGVRMQYPSDWLKRSIVSSPAYIPLIDIDVPILDPAKLYQSGFRMGIEKIPSQNLKEYLNNSINAIRSTPNYVDFKAIKEDTNVTLDGHPAFRILYVLTYGPTGITYEGTRIGTIFGNRAYAITAISDADKYSSYWPIMQEMIDSIHFYNASVVTKTKYQTYTNSTYGVKMQYPSDWLKNETFDNGQILKLDSPAMDRFGIYVAEVRLNIDKSPGSLNLDEYLKSSISGFRNDPGFKNFKIIENDTHSTLSGHPAYKIIFTYTDNDGVDQKGMEVGTFIGSNVYYIQSLIEATQYSIYSQSIQKIIDSFHN